MRATGRQQRANLNLLIKPHSSEMPAGSPGSRTDSKAGAPQCAVRILQKLRRRHIGEGYLGMAYHSAHSGYFIEGRRSSLPYQKEQSETQGARRRRQRAEGQRRERNRIVTFGSEI